VPTPYAQPLKEAPIDTLPCLLLDCVKQFALCELLISCEDFCEFKGEDVAEESGKEHLVDGILAMADRLFRELLPAVPHDLLSLDITMPQFKILLILYVSGSKRMSDIAAGLDVTLPTATSLVDRLVEKRFVERETHPDDRRVVLCHLADAGQRALSHIWQSARERSWLLLQAMEVQNLQLFAQALEAMLDAASCGKLAALRD